MRNMKKLYKRAVDEEVFEFAMTLRDDAEILINEGITEVYKEFRDSVRWTDSPDDIDTPPVHLDLVYDLTTTIIDDMLNTYNPYVFVGKADFILQELAPVLESAIRATVNEVERNIYLEDVPIGDFIFDMVPTIAEYQVCGWGLCQNSKRVRSYWSGVGGVVFRCDEHKSTFTAVVDAKRGLR